MQIFVDIVVIGVGAYFIFDLVKVYRSSVGSLWQRTITAAKGAAASLWTGFAVGVAFIAQGIAVLADLINAPQVAAAINQYFSPKIVAGVMVAAALIIEIAKRHSKPAD